MKEVWAIFDPLDEKIISIHKTEQGANIRCEIKNNKEKRFDGNYYYLFEVQKFELED